jgi:hypothetical protein
MKYYQGGQTDQMSDNLTSSVHTYLTRRIATSAYAIPASPASYLIEEEREEYLKLARTEETTGNLLGAGQNLPTLPGADSENATP